MKIVIIELLIRIFRTCAKYNTSRRKAGEWQQLDQAYRGGAITNTDFWGPMLGIAMRENPIG